MGITHLSLGRINKLQGETMCELGAQNIYSAELYGTIAKEYFVAKGYKHDSFDINPHQGANYLDLRKPEKLNKYDIVTDFGTSEHCDGNYYQVNKNIHDLCKIGGYIVRENPKTGNWPGHGKNYLTKEFYIELAKLCGYEIIELVEEPAMGNITDGWNIAVVLKKTKDKFCTKEQFEKLDYRTS